MRGENIAVLVHVDDVMLLGKRNYVENVFLPLLKSQFDLSCSLIKDVGDEFYVFEEDIQADLTWPDHFPWQLCAKDAGDL